MTKEESYKETKVCKCTSCGVDVTVTKFASAAKVLCPDCKKSGKQPNASILANIPTKKIEPRSKYGGGDTKVLPCIKCGKEVTVTKFASAAKVLCDECKGESGGYAQRGEIVTNPIINLKKLDRSVVPTLEEYSVTPALFNNRALRKVKCPACGHDQMKILKVLDWSIFGLIIHYQCPTCKLLMSVSEQTKRMVHYRNDGDMFDYSGESIGSGISAVQGSRMSMSVMKLMKILKEHNIEVEGDEIPPYLYEETRPVPVGYCIPKDDKAIKTIDDTIKMLENTARQGSLIDTPEGSRYIQISDTLAKQMTERLKELFKDGEQNG